MKARSNPIFSGLERVTGVADLKILLPLGGVAGGQGGATGKGQTGGQEGGRDELVHDVTEMWIEWSVSHVNRGDKTRGKTSLAHPHLYPIYRERERPAIEAATTSCQAKQMPEIKGLRAISKNRESGPESIHDEDSRDHVDEPIVIAPRHQISASDSPCRE